MATIHVTKQGGYWVVKKPNASRVSGKFDTQREAYIEAREIALNQGLSITVHGPNGRIQKVVWPQDRDSESGNCFITTACIASMQLPDDCYELQTLRTFRDSYVVKLPTGKDLIERYYAIAPKIVKSINRNSNRKGIYDDVFNEIRTACELIEKGNNKAAFLIYSKVVVRLSRRFKIN
jgi:hypothetical protein